MESHYFASRCLRLYSHSCIFVSRLWSLYSPLLSFLPFLPFPIPFPVLSSLPFPPLPFPSLPFYPFPLPSFPVSSLFDSFCPFLSSFFLPFSFLFFLPSSVFSFHSWVHGVCILVSFAGHFCFIRLLLMVRNVGFDSG